MKSYFLISHIFWVFHSNMWIQIQVLIVWYLQLECAELDRTAHSIVVLHTQLFPIRVRVTIEFPQDGSQCQIASPQSLIKVVICFDLGFICLLPIARLFGLLPQLVHLWRHHAGPFLASEFECVIFPRISLECRVHQIQKLTLCLSRSTFFGQNRLLCSQLTTASSHACSAWFRQLVEQCVGVGTYVIVKSVERTCPVSTHVVTIFQSHFSAPFIELNCQSHTSRIRHSNSAEKTPSVNHLNVRITEKLFHAPLFKTTSPVSRPRLFVLESWCHTWLVDAQR